MEPTAAAPAPASPASRTSPKDFFLWAGVIIALYGSVVSLIALLFQYINYAFPDALAGFSDPYGGPVRIAMAAVIVLTPTLIVLLYLIRRSIEKEPGKANIWVRRWAVGLTLFIAAVTILIDLITLINTFLGGEITERFVLKVVVVLLIAAGVFMHFLAETWGYWITYPKRATSVGIGVIVLAIAVVVSGFLIIGSPQHVRALRYDAQKVSDLQNIQYQVIEYWQAKRALPPDLAAVADPISGMSIPSDPQSDAPYAYTVVNALSFQLCANFNAPTPDTAGTGATDVSYPMAAGSVSDSWQHGAGTVCFDRTIDPQRYLAQPVSPANPAKPL
ncbi:MAG TPA: DUF5671 domain-containing protein [Candidatus Paceibacterota bacterium]|jgi:hypothetical protein|nr:DUF5671 domain-containing protein [Candidatus Paceibacterota bacterium]